MHFRPLLNVCPVDHRKKYFKVGLTFSVMQFNWQHFIKNSISFKSSCSISGTNALTYLFFANSVAAAFEHILRLEIMILS